MDIGTRMKTFYEEASKTKLMKRTPVAIRIDGRVFHTFTKSSINHLTRRLCQQCRQL